MTIEAACYKDTAHDSAKGNANLTQVEYTFTGSEAGATVVKLKKQNEYCTYWNIRVVPDAAFNAGTTIDLGYLSREEDGTDDTDYLGNNLDIVADQDFEAFILPLAVAEKHDLVLVINANNVANAGKKVTLLLETTATAG